MQNPIATKELPTVVKTVRLKTTLAQEIEAIAERENRNFSNMVETMLLKFIYDEDRHKTKLSAQ
ncbi:MAG: hypothetical protein RIF36_02900 [Imperialibacter sp.]|uniref:hypothetical protein n=1 Tax=Imperialibacter sp. TaxID=2038411 RepID=UPI0032EF676A